MPFQKQSISPTSDFQIRVENANKKTVSLFKCLKTFRYRKEAHKILKMKAPHLQKSLHQLALETNKLRTNRNLPILARNPSFLVRELRKTIFLWTSWQLIINLLFPLSMASSLQILVNNKHTHQIRFRDWEEQLDRQTSDWVDLGANCLLLPLH
jgi:hypothetical protein